MGLSCGCDYEPEPGDCYIQNVEDYAVLKTKRARRCCSCGSAINPGELAARANRVKVPESEIECKIFGEDGEIPIPPHWMCEKCADIFFSLEELGFCINPYDDMHELLADYVNDYAPIKETPNDRPS